MAGESSERRARPRPLSPHLQIYRPLINMVMSILHRITGAALYVGTVLLAAWLISAATSPECFAAVNGLFASWPGMIVLVGYSWALIHHALGGMRHFIWDTGAGARHRRRRSAVVEHDRAVGAADGGAVVLHRHATRMGDGMAMTTPLKRARGLGSAHEGPAHFIKQRITAAANLILFSLRSG